MLVLASFTYHLPTTSKWSPRSLIYIKVQVPAILHGKELQFEFSSDPPILTAKLNYGHQVSYVSFAERLCHNHQRRLRAVSLWSSKR
ncbi:hypothetical protein ACROYT_G010721 [Oculina patagonica]